MIRTAYREARMTKTPADQLFDYWRSLTVEDRIPSRADINPAAIKSLLPNVFILQLDERPSPQTRRIGGPDRDVTFRLVGSDICDLHTRELTNTSFRHLISPRDRQAVQTELLKVFSNEEAKTLTTRVRSEFAIIDIGTIVLPLSNGDEGCTRALGFQATVSGGHLWWKGAHPISSHELVSVDTLAWRSGNVIGDPRLQPPAYEVPVFELSRRGRRPEGRMVGHLTVIEGGA